MDAVRTVETVLMVVDRLGLLATLPTWTVDGAGPPREACLAPAMGAALPPSPYGYDDYDSTFFERFDGADATEITHAFEASFEGLVMLPTDTPGLGTESDDERVVTVRLGTPITIGATLFLWITRRAMHAPGAWVEEGYWVRIGEGGAAIPSSKRFGPLRPWSRVAWRRE